MEGSSLEEIDYRKIQDPEIVILAAAKMIQDGTIKNLDMIYGKPDQYKYLRSLLPMFNDQLSLRVSVCDWREFKVEQNLQKTILFGPMWDYSFHKVEVENLMQQLKEQKARTVNPVQFVLWNLNKQYLKQMEDFGLTMPESVFIVKDFDGKISQALDDFKARGDQIVVAKGLQDAGGSSFMKFNIELQSKDEIIATCKQIHENYSGLIIQEYLNSLLDFGEFGFVCFNLEKAYQYIKVPGRTDSRVQKQYGGRFFQFNFDDIGTVLESIRSSHRPDFKLNEEHVKQIQELFPAVIDQVKAFISCQNVGLPAILRIDFTIKVDKNGKIQILIMEIEGFEPHLELQERTDKYPEVNMVRRFCEFIKEQHENFNRKSDL
ncbi:UNKNOWN [Stylonychia lemnae]|uniref:ATP-grasp domain-containing protein n=1 Tax=Stylonychia lemnae TaxID=5949 RepID=A0A078A278_STYLE|nr:UNKNOWN [Stylonychia lemnae]|eukprot:CDW75608.1 UNKNOWN [Stylonychia lemnae]